MLFFLSLSTIRSLCFLDQIITLIIRHCWGFHQNEFSAVKGKGLLASKPFSRDVAPEIENLYRLKKTTWILWLCE